MTQIATIAAFFLVCCSCSAVEFGISYPPMNTEEYRRHAQEYLNDLNVKNIRYSIHWKYREPVKNGFNWQPLDERVAWAEKNGYSLFYTIESNGPDWACAGKRNAQSAVYRNDEDFRNFVTALAKRYTNRFDYIQFGNEWQTPYWYIGTREEYTRCANIVHDVFKKHSPRTRVVLGGFAIGALNALALYYKKIDRYYSFEGKPIDTAVMNRWDRVKVLEYVERVDYILQNTRYDYLDIHLYDDPENWHVYIRMIREKKPSVPLIVSEFGGPNHVMNHYSDSLHAAELERYMKTIRRLPVKKAYYFTLLESDEALHKKSGLLRLDPSKKTVSEMVIKKPAYYVFRNYTTKK